MRNQKIQRISIDTPLLKIGIISDTQLPPTRGGLKRKDTYLQSLRRALSAYREMQADMVLFAGISAIWARALPFGHIAARFRKPLTVRRPWCRPFWGTMIIGTRAF